jgi:hypothetical protein
LIIGKTGSRKKVVDDKDEVIFVIFIDCVNENASGTISLKEKDVQQASKYDL